LFFHIHKDSNFKVVYFLEREKRVKLKREVEENRIFDMQMDNENVLSLWDKMDIQIRIVSLRKLTLNPI